MCEYMEGNILFNDALNTFYLRLYGVSVSICMYVCISVYVSIYMFADICVYVCTGT